MDMRATRSPIGIFPSKALPRRRLAVVVDRAGATASLLCAVHCALLPFVLALLPLFVL
jgi:hypothetical protein